MKSCIIFTRIFQIFFKNCIDFSDSVKISIQNISSYVYPIKKILNLPSLGLCFETTEHKV